jgi:hypothetical protein
MISAQEVIPFEFTIDFSTTKVVAVLKTKNNFTRYHPTIPDIRMSK